MNVNSLLVGFRETGMEVVVVGGKLRLSPQELITADIQQAVVEHKAELMAALANQANDEPTTLADHGAQVIGSRVTPPVDSLPGSDASVPREWAEGLARLATMARPFDISPAKWKLIKLAAAVFAGKWARQAFILGWTTHETLGCNAVEPCHRWRLKKSWLSPMAN